MTDHAWQILEFPMPPSANNLHKNRKQVSRKGRMNTDEYNAFLNEVMIYELHTRKQLYSIKAWAKDLRFIRIHCDYFFLKHKLLCLDGRDKIFDVHNRQKALFDAVAKLIGIDDSKFRPWSGDGHIGPKNFVNIYLSEPE